MPGRLVAVHFCAFVPAYSSWPIGLPTVCHRTFVSVCLRACTPARLCACVFQWYANSIIHFWPRRWFQRHMPARTHACARTRMHAGVARHSGRNRSAIVFIVRDFHFHPHRVHASVRSSVWPSVRLRFCPVGLFVDRFVPSRPIPSHPTTQLTDCPYFSSSNRPSICPFVHSVLSVRTQVLNECERAALRCHAS